MRVVIAQVDQIFYDGEAQSLTVPAAAGEMTVLPEHMPVVTTLKPGVITVRTEGEEKTFEVQNGILEVRRDGATVVL